MDDLFHNLCDCNAFAVMMQETWLTGEDSLKMDGYTLIYHGLIPVEQSKCSSQGKAIALSPQAMDAWEQSGMTMAQVLVQVIALQMIVLDDNKLEIGLVLISAYATIGIDLEEAWASFFNHYNTAIHLCKTDDIVITGTH
eukprot:4827430-Ditylum_brightwellii.AAC.1